MADLKYNEFTPGTYNTDNIFLQADPLDGTLTKVNLPAVVPSKSIFARISYSIDDGNAITEIYNNLGAITLSGMMTINSSNLFTTNKTHVLFFPENILDTPVVYALNGLSQSLISWFIVDTTTGEAPDYAQGFVLITVFN